MIAPTQIRKPENWQDFEKLCAILWGEIWECQDTIKRNGRSGQIQHGVDIYGIPGGKDGYYGIQCKGKNDYTQSVLSENEIDEEIEKAKKFKPALQMLIFTTTAPKDSKIEEYVRCKNIENRKAGLFGVDVFAWEDIVSKMEGKRKVWNWYVNNNMYDDVCDVKVSFLGKNEITIHPQYARIYTTYIQTYMPANTIFVSPILAPTLFSEPTEYDGRWCDIEVKVENVGSITIEDYVLKVWFDEHIEQIEGDLKLCANMLMNPNLRENINRSRRERQEVFESEEYPNELQCRPKKTVLVEKDTKVFTMSLCPFIKEGDSIMHWEFLSRSYSKSGELHIRIEAEYIDKYVEKKIPYGEPIPQKEPLITYMIPKEKDK